MKKGYLIVVLSVLLSGLTAYLIVKSVAPVQGSTQQSAFAPDSQMVRTVNLAMSDYPDFTYAAEHAVEAVVYVAVTIKTQAVPRQQYINPFDFFFGYPGEGSARPQEREQRGSGSGVIIRPDGYIVTNNHVVDGATEVKVTLNNNKTYDAKVLGTDDATDVALIKIDAEGLPYIPFADSDNLRLGEWVLAIGSPYNLRSTITAGIVSAKGRAVGASEMERGRGGEPKLKIESFIQTDAAVNPGNSGGALVNKQGELVGINTMIYSQTGSYSGYAFAVPSNIVRKVVSDLIDFGSVKRAMLGVTGSTVDDETATKMKLNAPEGVHILDVVKGGAADKAGVKVDDIITEINGSKVATMPDLQAKVNSFRPGDKATVRVLRDGKKVDLKVEFTDGNVKDGTVSSDGSVAFYGAQLMADENGVRIVSAGNGKVARAGGEDGFLIRFVNDQKVSKPQDVIDIAKKSKRSIFIEGYDADGRPSYFGFGKDE